jgi:hypothetical protein
MDQSPYRQKIKTFAEWVILIIAACAAVLAFWLILMQFRALSGAFPASLGHRHRLLQISNRAPLTPAQIQGWMTFYYINQVFHLPPSYLMSKLGITASHYPDMSVNFFAKVQKKSVKAVLANVVQAVADYQKPAQ